MSNIANVTLIKELNDHLQQSY